MLNKRFIIFLTTITTLLITLSSLGFSQTREEKAARKKYEAGIRYYNKHNYAKAINLFQKVINKYPESKYASSSQYEITKTYCAQKKVVKAFELSQEIIEKYPGTKRAEGAKKAIILIHQLAKALNRPGFLYYKKNEKIEEYDKIKKLLNQTTVIELQKIIDTSPRTKEAARAQIEIAEVYYRLEDYEKATKAYRDFITNYPDDERIVEIIMRKGRSLYQENKYVEAKKEFQKVVDNYPDSPWVTEAKECIRDMKTLLKLTSKGKK